MARKPSAQIDNGLRSITPKPGGMTQEEIATKCGTNRRTIAYIEQGALRSFLKGLHELNPGMLDEIFGEVKARELSENDMTPKPARACRPKTRASRRETHAVVQPFSQAEIEAMPRHLRDAV